MIRLMYFSTATRNMTRTEVDEIVRTSASANVARGVTGMLAFNGRNFCQVLEGEEAQIDGLVEVIREDSRHAGFKVLGRKPIAERRFGEWSMSRVDALDFSEVMGSMDA